MFCCGVCLRGLLLYLVFQFGCLVCVFNFIGGVLIAWLGILFGDVRLLALCLNLGRCCLCCFLFIILLFALFGCVAV